LDGGNAHIAERRVVPHDVNDIRWSSVFRSEFGKSGIERLIFARPFLPVLGFKNIILSIVDNFATGHLS
jgi:hypothetical protein